MGDGHGLRGTSLLFPAIAMVVMVGCTPATTETSPSDPAEATSGATSTSLITTTTLLSISAASSSTTRSTMTSTSVATKGASAVTALSVLATIPIENENGAGYSRDLFRHWVDADGDSCNTREEVLIAESLSTAQVDAFGCKVVEGDWYSPYDNVRHVSPGELDIDHMVPLKEAWDSGAWAWDAARRQAFANDLTDARSLIAVTASVNRAKGDKDPSNWIPPNSGYLCPYLSNWVVIKRHWGLSMDRSEWGRIKNLLSANCPKTTAPAWGSAPQRVAKGVNAPGATSSPPRTTTPGSGAPAGDIHPGSYCTPVGAKGTYKGNAYVCATTNASGAPYSGGRAHWRKE